MPTDSKRKDAMQAFMTLMKTINGAGNYFRDLSQGDNVSFFKKLTSDRVADGTSFLWVRAGREIISPADISPGTLQDTRFDLVATAIVKDETAETMVEELEDLIHDVQLAIGSDRTLSNTVVDQRVTEIDPPSYGIFDMLAVCDIHVGVQLEWDYGTEI